MRLEASAFTENTINKSFGLEKLLQQYQHYCRNRTSPDYSLLRPSSWISSWQELFKLLKLEQLLSGANSWTWSQQSIVWAGAISAAVLVLLQQFFHAKTFIECIFCKCRSFKVHKLGITGQRMTREKTQDILLWNWSLLDFTKSIYSIMMFVMHYIDWLIWECWSTQGDDQ